MDHLYKTPAYKATEPVHNCLYFMSVLLLLLADHARCRNQGEFPRAIIPFTSQGSSLLSCALALIVLVPKTDVAVVLGNTGCRHVGSHP